MIRVLVFELHPRVGNILIVISFKVITCFKRVVNENVKFIIYRFLLQPLSETAANQVRHFVNLNWTPFSVANDIYPPPLPQVTPLLSFNNTLKRVTTQWGLFFRSSTYDLLKHRFSWGYNILFFIHGQKQPSLVF